MSGSRKLNGNHLARLTAYTSRYGHYGPSCTPEDLANQAVVELLEMQQETRNKRVDEAMLRKAANRARDHLFGKQKKRISRGSPREIAMANLPELIVDPVRTVDLAIDLNTALSRLSLADRRICDLLAEGHSGKAIAKMLGVEPCVIYRVKTRVKTVLAPILSDWNSDDS